MERQPRAKLDKNYNFEQFRKYTALFESAQEKDEAKSKNFFAQVQFVKENP